MPGIDDGLSEPRRPMASPPRKTVSVALVASCVTVTLLLTSLAIYGGSRISSAYALTGAIAVGSLTVVGTLVAVSGHRAGGAFAISIGAAGALYCVVSGLVVEGLASLRPSSDPLEPLAVADRRYLRHPSLGFLVGRPDDDFIETPVTAATEALTSIPFGGESRGSWAWLDEEYGRTINVALIHRGDEASFITESFLVSAIEGLTRGLASAPPGSAESLVREQRHEVWAHAVGTRAGGPLACTSRVIAWSDRDEGSYALFVMITGHPDDDFTSFLLDAHTPHERWRGPGAPPPGYEPAERTLSAARASFTPELLPVAPLGGDEPPEAPPDAPMERIRIAGHTGDLWAYASRPTGATELSPALLWLSADNAIEEALEPDSIAALAMELGLVVLVPSFRGERGNAGRPEGGLGEVDDAQAALNHLFAMPAVDPTRVIVVGEGIGGTITLLLAETGSEALAFVSIGGADELLEVRSERVTEPTYDARIVEESWVRSPVHFVGSTRSPTFYVDGDLSETPYAAAFVAAAPSDAPFHVTVAHGLDWIDLGPLVIEATVRSMRAGEIALPAVELERLAEGEY